MLTRNWRKNIVDDASLQTKTMPLYESILARIQIPSLDAMSLRLNKRTKLVSATFNICVFIWNSDDILWIQTYSKLSIVHCHALSIFGAWSLLPSHHFSHLLYKIQVETVSTFHPLTRLHTDHRFWIPVGHDWWPFAVRAPKSNGRGVKGETVGHLVSVIQ